MTQVSYAEDADVNHWLDELESSVIVAEQALRQKEWRDLGQHIVNQRRSTHGLKNALERRSDLDGDARKQIDERIAGILQRRRHQLERLELFQSEVGRRLRELTKFKYALKEMDSEPAPIALNVEQEA